MKMRPLLLLAVLAGAGCVDHVSGATYTGEPPMMVAGLWTYSVDISGDRNASCQANGLTRLNQASNTFTGSAQQGTWACASDAGVTDPQPSFLNFSNGEIAALTVRFLSLGCVYNGAADSIVKNMTGTVSCIIVLPEGGGMQTMTGNWHLSR